MIDPSLIGLVSAATALVASITGPLVTLYIGRAQIRASVRSANRQRWIDAFRELISQFGSQMITAVQVRDNVVKAGKLSVPAKAEYYRHLELVVFTATKIRLM